MVHAFDYSHQLTPSPSDQPPPDFDHPVFAAMDTRTRALLWDAGTVADYGIGETVATEGNVIFVQAGIIGHVPSQLSVCVAVSGVGSVFGLESALTQPRLPPAVALAPSRVLQVPAARLLEALGRGKLQELCIVQFQARMMKMEAEAACNAAHLAPQRLAKWLRRLHFANKRRDVCLTQADLARLLGVQRSTVNVAMRHLQNVDAIRFVRGRIIVQCADQLQQAACSCLP